MRKVLTICYHGTNKKNALIILKNGFKAWTYFALHLEDALGYGGNYIFEVCFESKKIPKGVWQFKVSKKYSSSNIVSCRFYPPFKEIKNNEKLREKIFDSNLEPKPLSK